VNFPKLSLKRFLVAAALSPVLSLLASAVGQRGGDCGLWSAVASGTLPSYWRQLNLSEAQRSQPAKPKAAGEPPTGAHGAPFTSFNTCEDRRL
jgi:hypothetical protein